MISRKNKSNNVNFFAVLLCLLLNGIVVSGGTNKFFDFFNFPVISVGGDNSIRPIKVFNGFRRADQRTDAINMAYYQGDTLAVVKIGPKKLLLDCSIIEIYEPNDVPKALGSLVKDTTALQITFEEMVQLMKQCSELDEMERDFQTQSPNFEERKNASGFDEARQLFHVVSSGIVPGTKWCGSGDVAKNFYDLGEDEKTDMCCRNHDLCPVKVRAFSKAFNLENNSPYTKSHCACDDLFHACMNRQNTRLSHILGHVYFNLLGVPCVEDGKDGKFFRKAKRFSEKSS